MIRGADIVKRYQYNKKYIKRNNWVVLPKETEEDKFLSINNILINHNDLIKSKYFNDELIKLKNTNKIATINFDMQNHKLSKNVVFGIPVQELVNPINSTARCHGCVLALGMCIDNFTWVYGNLTNRAMHIVYTSAKICEESILEDYLKEARNYNEVTPVFNHSYMTIKGEELLKQDIVNPHSFEQGFRVNPDNEYVIDPRYNAIYKLEDYNKIMQPEYFETISKSQLEQTAIWSTLKKQSKIIPCEYNSENLKELFFLVSDNPDNKIEEFLSRVIATDISCMMMLNTNLKQLMYEFTEDCLIQTNINEDEISFISQIQK